MGERVARDAWGCVQAHALVLPNYEALPEHDRVVNPALEVSLFKMAVDHIDKNTMQQNYKHIAHGNPNYFIAYSNGKSLARVEPGLRPHGAHRWASYNGTFQAFTHEQAAILHYTYNRCAVHCSHDCGCAIYMLCNCFAKSRQLKTCERDAVQLRCV